MPITNMNDGVSHFGLELSRGNVAGMSVERIHGHNPDLDTGVEEDMWEAGGFLTYLTGAETMEIASSDANDTSAGTGARTVLVKGLLSTYVEAEETVIMNGVTDVQTSNSYLRIEHLEVVTAGSGRTNAGNITATATSAATIQAEMDAGESLSQDAHYTVPLNKTAYITQIEFNAVKIVGGASPEIEFKVLTRAVGSSVDAPWVQIYDKILDTSVSDELDVYLPFYDMELEKTDIRITGTSTADNVEARCRLYLILVDD